MEVVVPLAHGHQCSKDMIARRSSVVKWLLSNPMRQTIHAKCSLLDKARSYNTSVDQSSPPIAPTQTRHCGWEDPSRNKQAFSVMLVLENNHRVVIKVRYIRPALDFWIVVKHHPPDVREYEAPHDGVWVLHCIGPSMMRTMVRAPPAYTSLNGSCTDES